MPTVPIMELDMVSVYTGFGYNARHLFAGYTAYYGRSCWFMDTIWYL